MSFSNNNSLESGENTFSIDKFNSDLPQVLSTKNINNRKGGITFGITSLADSMYINAKFRESHDSFL